MNEIRNSSDGGKLGLLEPFTKFYLTEFKLKCWVGGSYWKRGQNYAGSAKTGFLEVVMMIIVQKQMTKYLCFCNQFVNLLEEGTILLIWITPRNHSVHINKPPITVSTKSDIMVADSKVALVSYFGKTLAQILRNQLPI